MNEEQKIQEKQPLFEAETVYDEAAYRALVHLMIGKVRRGPRIALIGVGAMTVIASAAVMVIGGAVNVLGIALLALGALACLLGAMLERISLSMMLSMYKGRTLRNRYRFYEHRVIVSMDGEELEYRYKDLSRVFELDGYLFLFAGDRQTFIVGQKDVKGGYAQLRGFLNKRLK